MPLFSVIIPAFNNAELLPHALKSVENQTFSDWELIIVDDGSTDDTEKAIYPFLSNKRIKYFKQDNEGVTSSRNKGISKAKGDFVAFLDSDDEVEPNWLEDFFELTNRSVNVGYLSCGYFINETKKLPKLDKNISPERYSSLAGSFAIRKKILQEIGGYDLFLKQSENWEMTARALEYCQKNGYTIENTININFKYNALPSPGSTKIRDEHRAEATYYLYSKYSKEGILHYRKNGFLISSAVNYTRAGKLSKSRKIFYENFWRNPGLNNFIRIVIFEIPFLRKKKWGRKARGKKSL